MSLDSFITKFGGWTESYFFYGGEVELRYDPKDHVYLLVTTQGELEKQDGVTTVVHIVDKSDALIPWACKMMYQKVLRTTPIQEIDGKSFIAPMALEEFDKIIFEAKSAHTEKLEEAGEIGHTAHDWIENYIKLQLKLDNYGLLAHVLNMPTEPRVRNACKAALDWMHRHNTKWLYTERKIYSRRYKYAGTMDGLCECDSCDDPLCCPETFESRLSVADWKTSNYLYPEYLLQTAAYEAAYEEEFGVDIKERWVIRLGKDDGEFESWHLPEHNFEDDFGGFLDALDLTRRMRRIKNRISEKKADIRAALKAERDEARRLKDEAAKAEKALAKEKKAQERLEALALACKASAKYQGKRKPSCKFGKDGGPCVSCAFRYAKAQEKKVGVDTTPNSKKKTKPLAGDLSSLVLVLAQKVPLMLMAEN